MNKIEVCFSPSQFHLFQNNEAIVVVIDVLRATSAICAGLYAGVKSIIPVATIEEAFAYKNDGYIVAAERDGQVVEGFNFGNSPFDFMNPSLKGKDIVLTTTNGTQAIKVANGCKQMLIGSFLNLDVICAYLIIQKMDVVFLCAGWKNKFNLEDTLFAGAVAKQLIHSGHFNAHCDSTIASIALFESLGGNLFQSLKHSSHFHRLSNLDLEKDIKYCLTFNMAPIIPEVVGHFVSPLKMA